MTLPSYSDVFSITHERGYDEDIRRGDLVRTGPNLYPHFRVLAVNEDKAWLQDVQTGADCLAILARCRLIRCPALNVAAE